MKTSEIFERLADHYEKWGNYEKCTCSAEMYYMSWTMSEVARYFRMYEEGRELPYWQIPANSTQEEKLIENLDMYFQHLI